MRNITAWMTALVVLVSGNLDFYAAAAVSSVQSFKPGGLLLGEAYIEPYEDVFQESALPEEPNMAGAAADKDMPVFPPAYETAESEEGDPRSTPSALAEEPSQIPVAASGSSWEFAFAVAPPGSENHQRWQDHTMIVGQVLQYDLYFVWYQDDWFQLGSTLDQGMGIGLAYEDTESFDLYWNSSGYHLVIAPTKLGLHTLRLEYDHPVNEGERAVFELNVYVTDNEYAFLLAEPGSDEYQVWQEMTVEVGEQRLYDLHFAQVVEDSYEIIATEKGGMGITFQPWTPDNQVQVIWTMETYDDENHYYFQLSIQPTEAGPHIIDLVYEHPITGEYLQDTRVLHAVSREYAFVALKPDGGEYRPWLDPTVQVGDEASYSLRLARLINDTYQIDTEAEWGIHSQEDAHFTLEAEENGYRLIIQPTREGTFSNTLYYIHPVTNEYVTVVLTLYVLEHNPDDSLFTVTAPNGAVSHWNPEDIGSITIYYDGEYNPEQTLQIAGREEWTLSDPEGSLQLVSSGPDGAVYAMVRPTWEQPCIFQSGDAAMTVYLLFPSNVKTRFAVYDEDLANRSPAQLPSLKDGTVKHGEEIQVAVVATVNGTTSLIANPLNLLHTDRPVTVSAQPGDPFFRLTAAEGSLTLGIERGRSETVWVGSRKPLRISVLYPSGAGMTLENGDNLVTRIRARAAENFYPIAGTGLLVRSSDPDVIAVEYDEDDDSSFFLKPVGYGESLIYLESDEYYCEVLLLVRERQMPMYARQSDPANFDLPSSIANWGHSILPDIDFQGTQSRPLGLPCFTYVHVELPPAFEDIWSLNGAEGAFTSSDPDIVEVIQETPFDAYLNPVGTGTCTITYREGVHVKEIVVRSEPDALQQAGAIDPGFYTYYGTAHVPKDRISLEDGLPAVMALTTSGWYREDLDSGRFHFSVPGVARVELTETNLFQLVPLKSGVTTMTYTTEAGEVFELQISVYLPEPVWDFVIPDDTAGSGWQVWLGEQAAVGDDREREIFFAQMTLAADGSIHTIHLLDIPDNLIVDAQDPSAFSLVQRGNSCYVRTAPGMAGEYAITVTATPEGAQQPLTWIKRLYSSHPVVVTESTVAAINEAIRTAPVTEGYETVILLPPGYIPMDGDTPILLSRPVTLRGQDTVLASDVAALCPTPGAKLQNLTIRFDSTSVYNGFSGMLARAKYQHSINPPPHNLNQLLFAIMGDGLVTLENCELDGGARQNQCQYGVYLMGDGVSFEGSNLIRNFSQAGWILRSTPGARRYIRGLTFAGNRTGVRVIEWGSVDPYFIRLIESNFIDNVTNIQSDFPVNFSHNYFRGGKDEEDVTKSPQYSQRLELSSAGTPVQYPDLLIEAERLTWVEVLNFEGQAPIDSANFSQADGPVQIAVKELGDAAVHEGDRSSVLLQWSFTPIADEQPAVPFRPDATIDEVFDIPPDSGIETYQGVSFAHHGPLPLEGAQISVLKKTLFEEETLYLYRLDRSGLTAVGEIDNTIGDFYTFYLDGCSDYIITNVAVEDAGSGGNGGDGSNGNGGNGNGGDGNGNNGNGSDGNGGNENSGEDGDRDGDGGSGKDSGKHSKRESDAGFILPKEPLSTTIPGTATQQQVPAPYPGTDAADGLMVNGSVRPAADDDGTGRGSITQGPPVGSMDYSHIPVPLAQTTAAQKTSANAYVDEADIRAAFESSHDGHVVLDVGVKTVVNGLAFQLLAAHPEYTLVLKGDGYEWRFASAEVNAGAGYGTFDTAVDWLEVPDVGFARLSFAQQTTLPGSCMLVLETTAHPQEWAAYNGAQGGYMTCLVPMQKSDYRLTVKLDYWGEYVAII